MLAFLFDVDGVIVDSMPLHTEAWRVYMERLGRPVTGIEARMHGEHNDDLVVDFFGQGLSREEIEHHGKAKESLYREMMAEQLNERLVPGVSAFLARHGERAMAVGSNAEPANVDFVLDGADLRKHFKAVVDGMQVERPKPHPDIYLRAADLIKVKPSHCVVFEDSPPGVEAARAAGARVVGVETHKPLEHVDYRVRDFLDPGLDAWLTGVQA